jgi:hypothetical protein
MTTACRGTRNVTDLADVDPDRNTATERSVQQMAFQCEVRRIVRYPTGRPACASVYLCSSVGRSLFSARLLRRVATLRNMLDVGQQRVLIQQTPRQLEGALYSAYSNTHLTRPLRYFGKLLHHFTLLCDAVEPKPPIWTNVTR